MSDFDQKFLFVTGKGGVGKSTVAATIARAQVARGRRVLLAVTEEASISTLLDSAPPTPEVAQVAPRLSLVSLEPEAALREYAQMTLRSRALTSALVDNAYSRGFLAAVPGLHPWAVLGKAWFHANEREGGRDRFDSVIVDAPATGHGLQMLGVPKVISQAVAPGLLRRDAELAWKMLTDPARSAIVVVTLAEELPVQESRELVEQLHELGLDSLRLVVNGVLPRLFDSASAQAVNELSADGLSAEAREVLAIASRRASLETQQAGLEKRITEELSVPGVSLPWLANGATPEGIDALARALNERLTGANGS